MRTNVKGAGAERELAKIIQKYGHDARRGYVFNGTQDVYGLVGVHLEVKRHESVDMSGWLSQAIISAEKRMDGIPVVAHRKNRTPWHVTMRYADFEMMKPDCRVKMDYRPCFNLYDTVKESIDEGYEALFYRRQIGEIVTLPLDTFMRIYERRPYDS
ncbi:MAG: hypothetical protein IJP92_00610 [Lachnospiraceae bacterium]|nr:hypothetical protein [Lachnospiraceae bacterium]